MVKCRFCNTETATQKLMPPHLRWCKEYQKWKEENLKYDFLYDEYFTKGKSANQIALELGFCTSAVINKRITKLNIRKRNIAESKIMGECLERTKKTNMERWGAEHNFCRDHPSRKAWEKRLFDEEGITNVFQREDVKLKIVDHIKKNGRCVFGSRISQIHKYVYDMLIDNGIMCENEFPIKQNKRYISFYDIKILNSNILIEINGDLYHGNPELYKENDVIFFPGSKTEKFPKDLWAKDKKRKILAEQHGYMVISIWERDILHNPAKVIKIVNEILKGIGYEDCKISKDYKKFKRIKKVRHPSS